MDTIRSRYRALVRKAVVERELDDELRFHIEMQTAENLRKGMTPEEAQRDAALRFGGIEGHREACREARGVGWLENLLMDLRFALRHFRRTPLSTGTMVLVLALGIGVNVALFGGVRSMLTLPPPGVERDGALVRIRGIENTPTISGNTRGMSLSELDEYARHRELFTAVTGWSTEGAVLDVRIGACLPGMSPMSPITISTCSG